MSRSYRRAAPMKNPMHRVQLGEAKLEDFLSEGEFFKRIFPARWRTIRVFAFARSGPERKMTPGYILGLGDSLNEVAKFVQESMNVRAQREIFSADDLPEIYWTYPKRTRDYVAAYVRHEIFMRLLTFMRDQHHLWYMGGEWCMPSSVLDEYLLMRKAAKDSYRNERHFHGRPDSARTQCRVLRVAPGVSIGAS
jgi:hypothetical protein